MIFSAEFHHFRLPGPDLWLDVMQKMKAMGYTAISFYLDWAILEGAPGQLMTEGIFDVDAFVETASEVGLYLIARPGPYINAEVSGGGFPGWLQRIEGQLRSTAQDYINATESYVLGFSGILTKHQVSNGCPLILLQPENEYTFCADYSFTCLESEYMQVVKDQYRHRGIDISLMSNDAYPVGHFAPGTGRGVVDIYGFDFYLFGYGPLCSNPSNWDRGLGFPTYALNSFTHMMQNPSTPFSIQEFQSGASDYPRHVGHPTMP